VRLGHFSGDDLRDRVIALEQIRVDPKQLGLCKLGISDEPPVEPMAAAFDIGEQGSKHRRSFRRSQS